MRTMGKLNAFCGRDSDVLLRSESENGIHGRVVARIVSAIITIHRVLVVLLILNGAGSVLTCSKTRIA